MSIQTRLHILFVCPDAAEAEAVSSAINSESTTLYATYACDRDQVEAAFAQSTPHVLLGDLREIQTLDSLRERFPTLPMIAVSRRTDDAQIEAAIRLRVSAVLRGPPSTAAVQKILNSPSPSAEYLGHCRGVPAASLLSLYCEARREGVLHFRHPTDGRIGCVHLESGQPIHASSSNVVGSEAVADLLSWPEATVTWVPGSTDCARTIIGRWEGLLRHPNQGSESDAKYTVPVTFPEVMEKLARLSQTPDIMGAFLLHNAEVVAGRCVGVLDEGIMGRALCRLAHVFHDVEAQESEVGSEIQATVGQLRLVVDRIGPSNVGFQVGVIVRQASPVCKSLRRLLRQIDRSFFRAMKKSQDAQNRGELAVA